MVQMPLCTLASFKFSEKSNRVKDKAETEWIHPSRSRGNRERIYELEGEKGIDRTWYGTLCRGILTCEASSGEELCITIVKQEIQHLSRSCAADRHVFRRSRTRIGVFRIVNRHMYTLTLFVNSDRSRCEYDRRVDLLRSLLSPPIAHGDSEDNHLRGERLEGERRHISVRFVFAFSQTWAREDLDSTQNKLQMSENAKVSGELFAVTTTRLIPMTVNGAADSMSTATTLVYILDISGESAPSVRARACRRRKHIIEVTITFKLTVSEIHATARRTGFPPFSTDLSGKAVSTMVMIASTEKRKSRIRDI